MSARDMFGRWLKQRRKRLDLTQDALAAQSGCAVDTIRKLEAAQRRPSRQLVARLAEALQIPPADRVVFSQWARGHAPAGPFRPPQPPAVAADLQAAFGAGVWFVPLALLREAPRIIPAIARVLDVREIGGQALIDTLVSALQGQQLLLVLDNFEPVGAATRTTLGAAARAAADAAGRALPLDQALAAALAVAHTAPSTPPAQPAPAQPTYPADLTAREVEVLRLVAHGLTNPHIAARLCISPHTVHAHVRAIYGKLAVATRSAATRFAVEHGLV